MQVVDIMNLAAVCEGTGTMPRAGGLFDQDGLFVTLLLSIYRHRSDKFKADEARAKNDMRTSRGTS